MANISAPTTTASVTSQTTITTIDTLGFAAVGFQFTSVGSGSTVTFLGSNDGTNFVAVPAERTDTVSTIAALSIASPATTMGFIYRVQLRYFRLTCSVYGSGTLTVVATRLQADPGDPLVGLRGGSQTIGNVTSDLTSPTAATSRGGTIAAGGVAQTAAAALATRKGMVIQNSSAAAELLYIDFTGAATTASVSLAIGEKAIIDRQTCPTTALSVLGATTGHPYAIWEMT